MLALTMGGGMFAHPIAASAAATSDDGSAKATEQGHSEDDTKTGNMIFIHPDGSDAPMWWAARSYWHGPDAQLNWDKLPVSVPYRGHVTDDLTASSNAGATTHAFGYKVDAPDSFGTDSGAEDVLAGDAEEPRSLTALSGYAGSWLREAANAGHPIGVVNDGDVAEPGTAAFLTEVTERTDASALEIARQLVQGRPGFDDDADPAVIMGGGEDLFFPEGTPVCSQDEIDQALADDDEPIATIPATCVVHRPAGDTIDDDGPSSTGGQRTDDLNVAQAAVDQGYTLIRTRAEFEALAEAIDDDRVDPAELKVLGLFADEDIFNDEPEESLIERGMVDESVPEDAKETNLVLYGSEPGTPGYRPPTAPEMTKLATTVLDAHSEEAGKPFGTVWEVEGTDNLSNTNNAIGTLLEARYADEMIGVAREYLEKDPNTTVLTAADGTAGGLEAYTYNVDEETPDAVDTVPVNPVREEDDEAAAPVANPLDGRYGRASAPFVTEPDQFGQRHRFGAAWGSTSDFASGGVVARAEGLNADVVRDSSERFDNVDVYRLAYRTLFGESLDYPEGRNAPTRPADVDPDALTPGTPQPPSGSSAPE